MKCDLVRAWLVRDLDGAAEPSADAAAHLERCAACREEAGRLKAIAEAARAALPRADVPLDFTDRVMAPLLPSSNDAVLEAAARPRPGRWWPLLLPLLVLPFLPWWSPGAPETPETIEVLGRVVLDGATAIALEPTQVRGGLLLGGTVLLETEEPAVIETPVGEIRLRARSACVATLARLARPEGEPMRVSQLKKAAPLALTVTLLAGGAAIVNAQGQQEADRARAVRVGKGQAPRRDLEAMREQMAHVKELLVHATRHVADVQRRLDGNLERARVAQEEARLRRLLERGRRARVAQKEFDEREDSEELAELRKQVRRGVSIARLLREEIAEEEIPEEEILEEEIREEPIETAESKEQGRDKEIAALRERIKRLEAEARASRRELDKLLTAGEKRNVRRKGR